MEERREWTAVHVMWAKQRWPLPVLVSHESQLRQGWKDSVDVQDRKATQEMKLGLRRQHSHKGAGRLLHITQELGGRSKQAPLKAAGSKRKVEVVQWLHGD